MKTRAWWAAARVWRNAHQVWFSRALVLAFAALAGLAVVGFVWLSERALAAFALWCNLAPGLPLLITPLATTAIVWFTRRHAPGTAGSGIPQVMAALNPSLSDTERATLVSLRLSVAKFLLTPLGLLVGLSLGREGPSVQISAGILRSVRGWLPSGAGIGEPGLLVAGGAAGIAAAFNAPLAGVMFAVEELARLANQPSHGLVVSAIVLSGIVGISAYGDETYFGVISVTHLGLGILWPGLAVALVTGLAGGLFALLLQRFLGLRHGWLGHWRTQHPLRFAFACGLAVAAIGLLTHGSTFGSGYAHTRTMLSAGEAEPLTYSIWKFLATLITSCSGVPGGILAPSLSIGGALGNDVAVLTGQGHAPALIALGMAGFLAAVTQAPMTSFIIVMEMVGSHAMVLTLMACTLVANAVARGLSAPLYGAVARLQIDAVQNRRPAAAPVLPQDAPAAP